MKKLEEIKETEKIVRKTEEGLTWSLLLRRRRRA
jgi:hypothetical protein